MRQSFPLSSPSSTARAAGESSLIRTAYRLAGPGIRVIALDCRDIEPTPGRISCGRRVSINHDTLPLDDRTRLDRDWPCL